MSSSNGIAKNTMFLYVRMFLTMGISLYTSRVVLKALGVSDYGVYSVVGGVVSMFGFLNMAMASSTQRFLSFEIGKKNIDKLNKIFITAVNIHLLIAVIIVLLSETIGLWFINNKLNVVANRMDAVNWIYHFAVLSLAVKIIQVPFNALIIAREKMKIYAIYSIVEVLLKLLGVYLLILISSYDKLKLYAFLMFIITFLVSILYREYCIRNFKESKYTRFYDKEIYNELLSYSGWSLFGNIAAVARGQGSNILLNIFFGTVVNAAYGISVQVNSAVKQFVSNFQIALNPQIIKTYAKGDFVQNHKLIFQGSKLSFFLLFILACPIWINIDFVLELWLGNPPENTGLFVRLAIISLLVDSISGPLMIGAQATGKIKWYQIVVGGVILLDMPITYLILKIYNLPEYSYYVTISITCSTLLIRLFFLKKLIKFKIGHYLKKVVLNILLITVFSLLSMFVYSKFIGLDNSFFSFLTSSAFILLVNFSLIVSIGFEKEEKKRIKDLISKKIGKKNNI